MGSVETLAHKGTGVVCQAVKKIVGDNNGEPNVQPCILEVSDQGLRMVDRSKPDVCLSFSRTCVLYLVMSAAINILHFSFPFYIIFERHPHL